MISAEVPRKSYSHTVWPSLFPDEPICKSNLTGVHTATNTARVTWQSCAAFPLSCPLNWETFFSSQPLFLLLRENTSHWRCSADRWTGVPIHPCVQFYATDCYTDEGSGRAADWLCCSFDHVTATVKARTLMGPAAGERSLGYSWGNVSMSKTHTHSELLQTQNTTLISADLQALIWQQHAMSASWIRLKPVIILQLKWSWELDKTAVDTLSHSHKADNKPASRAENWK